MPYCIENYLSQRGITISYEPFRPAMGGSDSAPGRVVAPAASLSGPRYQHRSYSGPASFSNSSKIPAAPWLPLTATSVIEAGDLVGLSVKLRFQEMFGLGGI